MSALQEIFLKPTYDYEERFGSYWHQIRMITRNLPPGARCLEIGPGGGFVTDYLRKRNFRVETLDIDPSCNPTHVGSVDRMPLENSSFDCVFAFEVLEHLPFTKLEPSLREMGRVAKQWVVFSVPDARWFLGLDLRLFSSSKKIRGLINMPRLWNRSLKSPTLDDHHHWEIGRPGYSLSHVMAEIRKAGLSPAKNYRIPSNPLHHIFLLGVEKP